MARTITVSVQTIKQLERQVAGLSKEVSALGQEIARMKGVTKTFLPLVQTVLKDPAYPEERVLVLFSRWKRARSGFIKQTGHGNYMFRDGKGTGYQCHPSVDPLKVWIERTNEEWSCYEKKEGEHTPGFSATIKSLDEVIDFLAKANDKRRKKKKD